jgi:Uma2 family endonuclease
MGTAVTSLTIEKYLELPEGQTQRTELVRGAVVSRGTAKFSHERIKTLILEALLTYLAPRKQFKVLSETAYQLGHEDARIPDVSILSVKRFNEADPDRLLKGSPELAVEIVSSETADDLDAKVTLYLGHGSQSVWVFYPNHRSVVIYRPDGTGRRLNGNGTLEEPVLLPGFQLPLQSLFQS